MQHLEVSGAVRPIYGSLGVKRLKQLSVYNNTFGTLFLKHISIVCLFKETKTKTIVILIMVIIIVIRVWGWVMWSSNPTKNKDFVSSPKRSYWFRAPLNLLFFTQGKAAGVYF